MARPVSITKEKILAAALDIVRRSGPQALSARSLTAALGCGASPVFSSFGSMEGVLDAVKEEAQALYRRRVGAGLSLHPPFKGFGMAFLWFAIDEPQLYRLIMESTEPAASIDAYIDTHVGFKDECVKAISATLGLQESDAAILYHQMMLVGMGLAQAFVEGQAPIHLAEASEILGRSVRAHMMVIHAGTDEREGYVPQKDAGPAGNVDTYAGRSMEDALMGQNHLLQELHKAPRYIQDTEWAVMERVLRNMAGITPDTLKKDHPDLTPGDIRIIILDRLQFTVTEQAALLGISAPSVTKARQRMKAKMSL